ncbi:unknown [Sutterella wadsworthensis CAG:135]|nr:unknown [Sutterella wadsworthensis CAG:135]
MRQHDHFLEIFPEKFMKQEIFLMKLELCLKLRSTFLRKILKISKKSRFSLVLEKLR